MNRTAIAIWMVVAGFSLQFFAYFRWAAPLGAPTSPAFSDPRIPYAPAAFIFGVMLVFLSAVVYELQGGGEGESDG
ncbi:hypothetical protein H8D30_03535 [bacterium]|nr:hypothetical protein [bacterium]